MPQRQLLLLRHAKAAAGDPGMEDIDRPLTDRGERAAQAIGRYLAEHKLIPDLVLCSPARRTRQSWELVQQQLPQIDTRIIESLYDFGDGTALLTAIRAFGGTAARLLLVTHNPATQAAALALAGTGDAALRHQIAEKYPTAGLAIFSCSAPSWSALAKDMIELTGFIRPRDLTAA